MNFVVSLYRKQMMRGEYVLHKHPATALSWKEDTIAALVKSQLVHSVEADQYMYGLITPSEDDQEKRLPAMKQTRFMTKAGATLQAMRWKPCTPATCG